VSQRTSAVAGGRCRRWAVARRLPLVTGLALALALAPGGLAAAAAVRGVDQEYVKYYTVTPSYQGKPETLAEVAQRFLGNAGRSVDIYNLNVGRQQPDGATLTNPDVLRAGWLLVLPWDAVGAGVQYGLPSASGPAPAAAKPGTQPGGQPPAPAKPPAAKSGCAAGEASSSQTDWATLRLAPDHAWSHTRGKGQVVAIVDSGVEATVPQLSGHVSEGADIVTGSGHGDTDCLGSGTAMAGIIVAQPDQSGSLVGIAPDAAVLPVRVVASSPKPQPADEVTAIEVAVSAGATVVALGSFVDTNDPAVAQAVSAAVAHNVLVVAGASAAAVAVNPSASRALTGMLRVGGVGVDGQPAADYRPGGVDVMAPGINVAVLAINGSGLMTGTGTQYAVGYVAGEAALVRAAYPDLTVAQVVHRIEVTADKLAETVPDSRFGWGIINPGAAVSTVLADEHAVPPAPGRVDARPSGTASVLAFVAIGIVGLEAAVLLVSGIRRTVSARDENEEPQPDAAGSTELRV
jgi:membrane-anchored mycosin MYCP